MFGLDFIFVTRRHLTVRGNHTFHVVFASIHSISGQINEYRMENQRVFVVKCNKCSLRGKQTNKNENLVNLDLRIMLFMEPQFGFEKKKNIIILHCFDSIPLSRPQTLAKMLEHKNYGSRRLEIGVWKLL